jgi:hypothetical protein
MAQWSEPGADKVAAGARRAETGIDTAQRFRPRARRRFPEGRCTPSGIRPVTVGPDPVACGGARWGGCWVGEPVHETMRMVDIKSPTVWLES